MYGVQSSMIYDAVGVNGLSLEYLVVAGGGGSGYNDVSSYP